MKKIYLIVSAILLTANLLAQAPSKMSYQAVIRNSSNQLITNQAVGIRINILQGSVTGTSVYTETLYPTTNINGLVSIEIGNATGFNTINWANGPYFIKTETDPAGGTNYTISGTTQILSVPYALHAKTVETGDNWGSQAVNTNATLAGNGTTATPLGIADNGVTSAKIANGTLVSADLADNAVTTPKVANLAITTDKITNTAVTSDKIANFGVTSEKLATGSVTADKIAGGAVSSDKLSANSVTSDKINAGAVTGNKIAQSGATSGQALKWSGTAWAPADDVTGGSPTGAAGGDLLGTYPNPLVGDGKITSAKILDGTVGNTDLADNSVTSIKITDGAISTADLANLSVTSGKLADNAITDTKIANGAVTGSKIAQSGATTGQALKWNGTTWAPGADIEGGLTLPYTGTSSGTSYAFSVTNSSNIAIYGLTTASGGYVGVYGQSDGTEGRGVWGYSTATTGLTVGVGGGVKSSDGTALKGIASAPTGTTYGVNASVASNDGFSGYFSGGKFYVSGNVGIGTTTPAYKLDISGNARVSGTLTVDEVKKTATGAANMMPLAYGTISAAGAVLSGSGNISAAYVTNHYEITIIGENYFYSSYTSLVTPVSSGVTIPVTSSNSNKLMVYLFNTSGATKQDNFSFIVYKQ